MRPPSSHHAADGGSRARSEGMENKAAPNGAATITVGGKTIEPAGAERRSRPRRDRHPQALRRRPTSSPTTRASPRRRAARARSPSSTATRASCCTAATRSTSWPSKSTFLEVCYLLLNGELPTAAAVQASSTGNITAPHHGARAVRPLLRAASAATPTRWRIMVGAVGALAAFYHDSTNIEDPDQRTISAHRLIAKMPTIAARAYKYSIGQPFVYPRNELGYAENFLRMCFAVPAEDYVVDPVLAGPWTASSSCTPTTSRTPRPRPCAWPARRGQPLRLHRGRHRLPLGPRARRRQRRGAQHAEGDRDAVDRVPEYVQGAKDRKYRLMGFGHRAYKNHDPRAKVMQVTCHEVLDAVGKHDDPLLQVAMELEKVALSDEFFIERKLYPRTSTSIRASPCRRWASRPRCSPCCSPWRAPSAGSRSGRK